MNKKTFILFLILLVFGIFLRFYKLGSVPIGFHVDEAYLGYNAYSLLKTGRDMLGNFLPIHLASFLYSPDGYSYSSIPWIFLFGLNSFSLRFSSAFFGSLSLIAVFLLSSLLVEKKFRNIVGLSAMGFLAISPWNIDLNRTSTDNSIVVFLLALGLYFFILWQRKNSLWYGLCAFLAYGLTLITYQAPRAFLPFFLPIVIISLFYKQKQKLLSAFTLFFLVILLPIVLILVSPQLSQRINQLSIFKSPSTQLLLDEQIREDGVSRAPIILSRLFHNKITAYSSVFIRNYSLHFSYDFLFGEGYFPNRYKVPSMGLLYFIEIPFLILGIYFLLKRQTILGIMLIGWILTGPIGSALTFDDIPNMQRTMLIFPAVSLIEGFGFLQVILLTNKLKRILQLLTYGLLAVIFCYSLGYYSYQYYVNGVVHRPWYRQEGTKEMVETVNKLKNNYSYVDVGDADPNLSIFFLLFSAYDPRRFQSLIAKHPELTKGGHYGSISFDKYVFDSDGCPVQERLLHPTDTSLTVTGKQNVLYVDAGICKIPTTHVNILNVIKKPDNTTAYTILEYIP